MDPNGKTAANLGPSHRGPDASPMADSGERAGVSLPSGHRGGEHLLWQQPYRIEIYCWQPFSSRIPAVDVRTLCLGALCLGDATGYDIKKLFESAFNHFHHAGFGSIYPALKRLEQEGLVQCRVARGERHPDRKIFAATGAGKQAFHEALVTMPPAEQSRSDFMVLLFFAHLMPPDLLAARLDEVQREWEAELRHLQNLARHSDTTAGIALTFELGSAVYRAKLETLRARRPDLLARHDKVPPAWRDESA
jgi:DNA-binding PadR family transcriptional regulator